jgi:hypothetical protein
MESHTQRSLARAGFSEERIARNADGARYSKKAISIFSKGDNKYSGS